MIYLLHWNGEVICLKKIPSLAVLEVVFVVWVSKRGPRDLECNAICVSWWEFSNLASDWLAALRQPIGSHVWKFLSSNMDFNMEFTLLVMFTLNMGLKTFYCISVTVAQLWLIKYDKSKHVNNSGSCCHISCRHLTAVMFVFDINNVRRKCGLVELLSKLSGALWPWWPGGELTTNWAYFKTLIT